MNDYAPKPEFTDEEMRASLLEHGWKPIGANLWKSPKGTIFGGLYYAFKRLHQSKGSYVA